MLYIVHLETKSAVLSLPCAIAAGERDAKV
jgi:hypothetical protein